MKTKVLLFIVSFIIWLGLTWSVQLPSLAAGIAAAMLVALLTHDLFAGEVYQFRQPYRYMLFLKFIPILIWECIKANFDVAYRVIHLRMPINPGIVKIKTQLKSELALTFLANSITLTPGTLTVDVDKENGLLYIHWIDIKDEKVEEATRRIAGSFEPILRRIFE